MSTIAKKKSPKTNGKANATTIGGYQQAHARTDLRSPGADDSQTLISLIDSSSQVQQFAGLQKKIDQSPHVAVQLKQQQTLFGTHPAQRQEDEEPLQGKSTSSSTAQLKETPQPANKTGMPDQLKTGLENLSGLDMSDVRVHYNSSKPAQLKALAYTQGTDTHVASGQEKHLPHEGWHAVQQMQGRVQPTTQVEGAAVNDNNGLEKEADVMGGKALQFRASACHDCRLVEQPSIMQMRPIYQLQKNIHHTVYYGKGDRGGQRERYMRANLAPMATHHCTVDTLNTGIGLTQNTMSGPIGQKRINIRTAIDDRGGDANLSQDEKDWAAWLEARREPLLLPDMTGAQCRYDMRLDNSWWKRTWKRLFPPSRHKIDDGQGQGRTWKQEAHSRNIQPNTGTRFGWTNAQRTLHNNFVESDRAGLRTARTELEEGLPSRAMFDEVKTRSWSWFQDVVRRRFWRLTSKMGLDFFAHRNTNVDFVRDQNYVEVMNGRRSITNSEWEHAQNQGYLGNSVTRRDPV